jgi:hypothetical protein
MRGKLDRSRVEQEINYNVLIIITANTPSLPLSATDYFWGMASMLKSLRLGDEQPQPLKN